MHHRFFLFLILLFPLFSNAQQWTDFADSNGRFIARYPSDWTQKTGKNGQIVFSSPANDDDNFHENVSVLIQTGIEESITVKVLLPVMIETMGEKFEGFKLQDQRKFKWNKVDAAEYIFTCEQSGITIRATQRFCIYNSNLYTVTYLAEDKHNEHNDTASEIIKSIEFR